MWRCNLWCKMGFQIPLLCAIIVGVTQPAASDEGEHIHIKVHVPKVPKTLIRHQRMPQQHRYYHHYYPQSKSAPPPPPPYYDAQSSIHYPGNRQQQHSPNEFDLYGLDGSSTNLDGSSASSILSNEELMNVANYGPVVFNPNDLRGLTGSHHSDSKSKHLMHQLLGPDVMTTLIGEQFSNNVNENHLHDNEKNSLNLRNSFGMVNQDEFFNEYLRNFSAEYSATKKTPKLTPNWSLKLNQHKRKNYPKQAIATKRHRKHQQHQEEYFKPKRQQQQSSKYRSHYNFPLNAQQQREHRENYYQHELEGLEYENEDNNEDDDNDNDNDNDDRFDYNDDDRGGSLEFADAGEDIPYSTSNEDMATAFNGFHPISYQDMYGSYATPATSSIASPSQMQPQSTPPRPVKSSASHKLESLNYQHQYPSYAATNWNPFQSQSPSQFQQQQQQQRPATQVQRQKNHHHNKNKYPQQQKPKSKSHTTQFVIQQQKWQTSPQQAEATALRLATPPISNDFGGTYKPNFDSTSPLSLPTSSSSSSSSSSSTSGLDWKTPYDFVQQSHQQQLGIVQHWYNQQLQQQQPPQHQQQQLKPAIPKKPKNRTKRKRNRIIVE